MSPRHRGVAERTSGATASAAPTWHAMGTEECGAALRTDLRDGLDEGEARRRAARLGPNVLAHAPRRTWLDQLAAQVIELFTALLGAAAAVSFLAGETTDGIAILAILAANVALGFAQEFRAERALRALRTMTAPQAHVRRAGDDVQVPAAALVPGDVIILSAGDVVPADGRLIAAPDLRVSEAVLTGESVPVDKDAAPVAADAELVERTSMVFQGSLVVHGRGEALVTATGGLTEMGRIASAMQRQQTPRTPLQRRLDAFARSLSLAVGGLIGIVFAVGVARGLTAHEMFLTAISLGVAAVPEGLPAATTIVLALGVQRMARRRAVVRRLSAVEGLGAVTVICADKTGTLTENRMAVEEVWVAGSNVRRGAGGAWPQDVIGIAAAARICALCNDAQYSAQDGRWIGDPTEVALAEFAETHIRGAAVHGITEREMEIPFSPARARMTVVYREDGRRIAYVKGAPEVIVPRSAWGGGTAGDEPLDDDGRRVILSAAEEMGARGLRVLALAQRALPEGPVDPEDCLVLVALAGIADPLRPESGASVRRAGEAGVRTIMITGDHPVTACAIALEVGLAKPDAMLGRDIEQLTDGELAARAQQADVFARATSEHKLRIVRALQGAGEIVAMTGDGVNDAPALRAADVGIAMGRGGTDVAREASDLVLVDNNFASIVSAIEEGRTIFANIRKFVHYLLTCNLAEIAVVFAVLLAAGQTPLLPLHILFVNLLTDGLPALALGVEPGEAGSMAGRPRPDHRSILSGRSALPLLGIGAPIVAATTAAYAWGQAAGNDALAMKLTFATLVGSQLAAAFAFRSETRSAVAGPVNIWLLAAVATSIAALATVFYVRPLQDVFETQGALSLAQWLGVAGLSLAPLLAVEAVKLSGAARLVSRGR